MIRLLESEDTGGRSVPDLLATLRVLREFEETAQTGAEGGKIAERKLKENG